MFRKKIIIKKSFCNKLELKVYLYKKIHYRIYNDIKDTYRGEQCSPWKIFIRKIKFFSYSTHDQKL